ncbi:DEAD/DEAH box helicase [Paenibacillus kobensis]|uniref:DEAD/DEAH box helicase n=1 Tax=Paenibacillus kobensis TaxID=59841 RepID=UPI000FD6E2EE|nr:DEAD/DEAH box helicase [Paenibacillus kobensis]
MSLIWTEIGVDVTLADALAKNGLTEPTPVQREAIAVMLDGADVTARSQTGSGKTLAFLLPVLQRIDSASSSVQAVVLAPTQELAMQITRVAQTYGAAAGIRVVPLIGGAAVFRQIDNLKKNKPQLVVGTPGRIHELFVSRKLKLGEVKHLIIDEADQVFDLGSSREVDALLKGTPRDRQLAFFSATRPDAMADMERKWMRDPKLIDLAGKQRVAETIEHLYVVVDKRDKVDAARRLVRLVNPSSALLFLNDTDNIAQWESKLKYEGFTVEMLYGDANKQRRSVTLDKFRSGGCKLLIATDVAARGIDIPSLPLVLNLDPPIDADHYVHRAGRTGRMGKQGLVITMITHQERFIMDKFSKRLGIEMKERVMAHGKLVTPDEARLIGTWSKPAGLPGSREAGSKPSFNSRVKADTAFGSRPERPSADARTSSATERGTYGRASAERSADRPRFDRSEQSERTGAPTGASRGAQRYAERPSAPRQEEPGRPAERRDSSSDKIGGKPGSGKPSSGKPAPAMTKKQQKKAAKDKGAPKWLKAKRAEQQPES